MRITNDPIFSKSFLQGLLSANCNPIRKRSVEKYLFSVIQIFAAVGANDPWHNCLVKTDFRLGQNIATHKK